MLNSKNIDINDQFKRALDIMENSGRSVFLMGRAGTGKSTLLEYFRGITKKKTVVLAPTGVAAMNVKGQTIHSFFKFKPDITIEKVRKTSHGDGASIYKRLETIVIDEISMVRSDLLDCVDRFMRLNGNNAAEPFGGAQMVFIGDLCQLPPIVTPQESGIFGGYYKSRYFFDAKAMEGFDMEYIELEKVYRQKDTAFIELLNAFRDGKAQDRHIEAINKRYFPDYSPEGNNFTICLTTTNAMASDINERELAKIKGDPKKFTARIDGEVDEKSFPTERELFLKAGAQIMMLNNDPSGRWVNGSIGKITEILNDSIIVEFEKGGSEAVQPFSWEIFRFSFNKDTNSLSSDIVGTFTQFPMKLAWAITIHKSQGLTFDQAVIDIGGGTFAHGQLYVALSRCRTIDGIILKKKIQPRHMLTDRRIKEFIAEYQNGKSEIVCPFDEKIATIEKAIKTKRSLDIAYLKASNETVRCAIMPALIEEMEYQGKPYLGVKARCYLKQETRVFMVDRILEIRLIE